jgi:DNA-binding PadR family transcriptional regulator
MTPQGTLRPNWFHVLAALAQGDRHGSAIARDVLEQTEGQLRLWPATLYRTLDDMAGDGVIEELAGDDHPEGASARRRFYRITRRGRSELAAAAERISGMADVARRRLKGATP